MRVDCEAIVRKHIRDADKYQFGATKIFFRAGQVAYLEKLRSDRMRSAAVKIQARVRGWLKRKRFLRLRRGTVIAQCLIRRNIAQKLAERLRQTAAAIKLQAYVRMHLARQRFHKAHCAVLALQRHIRGYLVRRDYLQQRRAFLAVRIQSMIRGYFVRRHFKRYLQCVVTAQSCVRRFLARKQLRQLRIAARSVEGLKQINFGLERKVIELQQKMDARLAEAAKRQADRVAELEHALDAAKKTAVSSSHTTQTASDALTAELQVLREQVAVLKPRNEQLEHEIKEAQNATHQVVHVFEAKVCVGFFSLPLD